MLLQVAEDTPLTWFTRKFSTACSMFLKKGGTIDCVITGSRRYSADLVQGGLEVPCSLIGRGNRSIVDKVEKLLSVHDTSVSLDSENGATQARKKAKLDMKAEEEEAIDGTVFSDEDVEWLFLDSCKIKLYLGDKLLIRNGQKLNDKHINFAQCLLKSQYPTVDGLNCMLYQHKMKLDCSKTVVQIVHILDDHWIVVSNVDSAFDEVRIYDSFYPTIHEETKDFINSMFDGKISRLTMAAMQKQEGSTDCGVFCIVIITSLLHNYPFFFNQSHMQSHLITCFENYFFITFPHTVALQNSFINNNLFNVISYAPYNMKCV